MEKNVPLPWVLAAVLAFLVIVGAVIWHKQSAQQAVLPGPSSPYEEYGRRGPGGPPGGAPGLPPGVPR